MKIFAYLFFLSLLNKALGSDIISTFTFGSTSEGNLIFNFTDLSTLASTSDTTADIRATGGDGCDKGTSLWMTGISTANPVNVMKEDMAELKVACLEINNYDVKNLKLVFKHTETVTLPTDLSMFETLRVKQGDDWEDLLGETSFTRGDGTYDFEVQLKDPSTPAPTDPPTDPPTADCSTVGIVEYQNAGCCTDSSDPTCDCLSCE